MGFLTKKDEFFHGLIVDPEDMRQSRVIVNRGTRAATIRLTCAAASQRGWTWEIQLLKTDEEGERKRLASWNQLPSGTLPPARRQDVPGLA